MLILALSIVLAVLLLEWADSYLVHPPAPGERRFRAPNLSQFRITKLRGHAVAVTYGLRSWWADVVGSWSQIMRSAPTFAQSFPLLHWMYGGARWLVSSPRAMLTAGIMLLHMIDATPAAAAVMGPIRHMRNYAELPAFNGDPSTNPNLIGQRQTLKLRNSRANRYLQVRTSMVVVIAGVNATAVRNLGLPSAFAFREMGITGGGDNDTFRGDGRLFSFASEFQLNASAATRTRLTSPNITAGTQIVEQFRLFFENPRAVVPRETVYLEKLVNQDLFFFFQSATATTGAAASTAGAGALLDAPVGCTVTLSAWNVRVQQLAATGDVTLPQFRPEADQISVNVPGANARLEIEIPVAADEYLRGVTVMQVDGEDFTEAVIGAIALRGDNYEYLGEGTQITINDYVRALSNYETGGDLFSLFAQRVFHYDFQQEGRLSNIYNPSQDNNLRLIVQANAGSATTRIVILKHSLKRDTWVGPAPTFRRIVAENLDPALASAA